MKAGFMTDPLNKRAEELRKEADARLYPPSSERGMPPSPPSISDVESTPPAPPPTEPAPPATSRSSSLPRVRRRGRAAEGPRRDEGHTIYFEPSLWTKWDRFTNQLVGEGHREVSMSMLVRIALRNLTEEQARDAILRAPRL